MSLAFVLVADRRLELRFFRFAPFLAGGLQAVALDRGQHAGGLLAAHDRDARIRPGPKKARTVGAPAHGVVAGAERAADDDGELGHVRAGHGRDHLGTILGNAGLLVLLSDHEAGDVLKENQWDIALIAQLYEVRALQRRFGEQDAVVGDDADRVAVDVSEAGNQRGAVARLEFLELRTVDQARDDLADLERVARVVGQDAVDVFDRVGGRGRCPAVQPIRAGPVEVRHDVARDGQGVRVVFGEVIGDAGQAGMHIGAAERFGVDFFTGGGLDQRRPTEKDGALFLDDHGLVAHRRHVGAAGGARAHDHGDLGNVLRRKPSLVVEDAAEVFLVRKHFVLQRQESAAGIDQVDARQAILQRDFLRPQMLLDRHRVIGAALDRRVVGHDHALHALDAPDAGDHAGGRRLVVVQPVGGHGRDFQERASGVEQGADPLPGQQLAARQVLFSRLLRPAQRSAFELGAQFAGKLAMVCIAGAELAVVAVDLGWKLWHRKTACGKTASVAADRQAWWESGPACRAPDCPGRVSDRPVEKR